MVTVGVGVAVGFPAKHSGQLLAKKSAAITVFMVVEPVDILPTVKHPPGVSPAKVK